MLSYIYPVRIDKAPGTPPTVLEVYLYRGQWQLATLDALYSDGNRYRPVLIAYKELKQFLPAVKNVLLLGTGLGSAVKIMDKQGFQPRFTLVEIDKLVLKWAMEYLDTEGLKNINPVCDDAKVFINTGEEKYDLVIVDIFKGRVVPAFVTTLNFLQKCRSRLNSGGHFVMNYIINTPADWAPVQANLSEVFPGHKVIRNDINMIIIAGV